MIKNIVFDFGKVMVRFDPEYMVSKYVSDKDDINLLESVVFDRLYWDKLDEGTISDDEVVRACKERLPSRLHSKVDEIYYNWIYNIPEIEGMRDLVIYLKKKYGVRIFLLSNICKYFASHSSEISILKEFDDCIFSAVCGYVKPHKDIYAYLCDRCSICPDEAVFIDDNVNNVRGAEEYGIKAYLFDGDINKLKTYLDELLIN